MGLPTIGGVHPSVEPTDGPIYGLDIETDTSQDGLDPRRSRVVAAAVSTSTGEIVFTERDESELLRSLDAYLATLPAGVVTTWNGGGFDLPFIATRAARQGLDIGLAVRRDPTLRRRDPSIVEGGVYLGRWHRHAHLDGYRLYRNDVGRQLGLSCGLKSVARLVGFPAVEVDSSAIHGLSSEVLAAYVASDARLARALVCRRLPAARRAVDRP